MELQQIGVIHSPFPQPDGVPIQPRYAQAAEGTVEVFQPFAEGLRDYALLQTVKADRDGPLFAPIKSFADFPKDAAWRQRARGRLLARG